MSTGAVNHDRQKKKGTLLPQRSGCPIKELTMFKPSALCPVKQSGQKLIDNIQLEVGQGLKVTQQAA